MSVYKETMEILKKYNVQANKSLGQNFLVSDDIVDKIIETANLEKNDFVIEIGPGLGVLTNRLLEKCNNVVAVELDKRMIKILKNRFSNNLEIINEDILQVDLANLIQNKRQTLNIKKVKVVANLPYYISTPIIIKLLEQKLQIDEIIVMVQKEVAERLTAQTGTRISGAITYVVEYFSEATPIMKVPRESFIPSPKVESEVIKLKVRGVPKVKAKDEKMLFDIIQKSFSQRRKTLANALVNYNIAKSKIEVDEMFKSLELDNNVRGENLTLEQFAKITNYLSK